MLSKSLKAKKHVYIEKPMCTTKKQGEILLKIARKNNLEIFVGQIFLYHPVLVKLKKLLKNEKIDSIYLGWHRFGPFKEKLSLDLLSHFITILQELFNQPKIRASTRKRKLVCRANSAPLPPIGGITPHWKTTLSAMQPSSRRGKSKSSRDRGFAW